MKATEAVESWKNLGSFIFDRISGFDKEPLSDEDWELIDREGSKILSEKGLGDIMPKVKKILGVNILDKNTDFKFLEKIPHVWKAIYTAMIDITAAENGQSIMAW